MKKIKIKYWVALGAFFLAINSCKESNLDVRPLGPTEADYFKEEIEFERAVWGVYAKMSDFYGWGGGTADNSPNFGLWLLPGDDITTEGAGSDNTHFETFNQLEPSNGPAGRYYSTAYKVISRANVLLEKIEQEEGVYTTPDLKKRHRGEALFLRGLMYFNLWNFFGTSPVITKRLQSLEDVLATPSEGTQLIDQAILDLTEAATLLPPTWGDINRGRATANSAYGMLGKALVYRGTVTKNTQDFINAIAAFDKITGASLVANWSHNFSSLHENNEESIFEWQAAKPSGTDIIWLPDDFDNAVGTISTTSWVPFKNINNWAYGGKPFIPTQKLIDAYEVGDPRMEITLDSTSTDRKINKYAKNDIEENAETNGGSSINNPRILRYADVLLLKAEAIVQSGGSLSEAVDLINQVRARARNINAPAVSLTPVDRVAAGADKDMVMQWIMDERFIELAGEEGIRWMDLRRWHMAGLIQLDTAFFSSVNTSISFNPDKHLYFPIPLAETDRNNNMRQNKGY